MEIQIASLLIGFVLGIIGSLAAAFIYESLLRPSFSILPDPAPQYTGPLDTTLFVASNQGVRHPASRNGLYHLVVRNVPLPHIMRRPAWSASITLDVLDEAGNSVVGGPIPGRWSSHPEPLTMMTSGNFTMPRVDSTKVFEMNSIDIHPHHPEAVLVIIKGEGDLDCYLFNSSSYLAWDRRIPEWRIPVGQFRLRVTINHGAGSYAADFQLSNRGPRLSDLVITPWL